MASREEALAIANKGFQQGLGRTIGADDKAGQEAYIRFVQDRLNSGMSPDDAAKAVVANVVDSPEFRDYYAPKILTEAYNLGLGRELDPSGKGTYTNTIAELLRRGKSINEAFNEVVKIISNSEEARLRGAIAIERDYLDKYVRPIQEKLAREEIAPEFKEKLQDQLTRFDRSKERAKTDLGDMVRGFVNSQSLLESDPNVQPGAIEQERRRLLEDFNRNVEQLAKRQQIDFRNLNTSLGLGEIGFGGTADRSRRELGDQYDASRTEQEIGKTRGVEDLAAKVKDVQKTYDRSIQDVDLEKGTFERDIKREEEATAQKLTEQRLLEPAQQRRNRVQGILGDTDEAFKQRMSGIDVLKV